MARTLPTAKNDKMNTACHNLQKDHPSGERGVYIGEVVDNRELCSEHYLLTLAGKFPPTGPGQFVQLQCRGLNEQCGYHVVDLPADRPPTLRQPELADKEPLLRRPLSLAGRRDRTDGLAELDIIYRTIGTGTHWLSGAGAGTKLSLLGPLGNAFTAHDDKPAAALIGGGVGIPPMIYLAKALTGAGKNVTSFYGVRSADMLPVQYTPDSQIVVATDDGSMGFAGTASDAFWHWFETSGTAAGDLAVYSCGPEVMMQAIGELCIAREITCELALERHMACGMGTCQSCVVKIRDNSEPGWSYKLCCKDGPAFDALDIIW